VTLIHLKWEGPRTLPDSLLQPGAVPRAAGVYLWAWRDFGRPAVHYVGYASSIWDRQYQHVINFLGGGYPIETRGAKRFWTPERPATGRSTEDYEASVERMMWILREAEVAIGQARDYLNQMYLFAAEAEAAEAKTAEWMLQTHLGLSKAGSSIASPARDVSNEAPAGWRDSDLLVFGHTLTLGDDGRVHDAV